MKKQIMKIALITATAASLLVAGCSKNNEKDVPKTSSSKASPQITMTLEWANNKTKCQYIGVLGALTYDYYVNGIFVGRYTNLDSSSVSITPADDHYIVEFPSISNSPIEFAISDISTGVNDTIFFNFKVNGDVANSFMMFGGYGFLESLIEDRESGDTDPASGSRSVPYINFFPDGIVKLIGDCSFYNVNLPTQTGDNIISVGYDYTDFRCAKAMSVHLNDLSAHPNGNHNYNHVKKHNPPTHIGCGLTCNGSPVTLQY